MHGISFKEVRSKEPLKSKSTSWPYEMFSAITIIRKSYRLPSRGLASS